MKLGTSQDSDAIFTKSLIFLYEILIQLCYHLDVNEKWVLEQVALGIVKERRQ
jgi:hypothetical protein